MIRLIVGGIRTDNVVEKRALFYNESIVSHIESLILAKPLV